MALYVTWTNPQDHNQQTKISVGDTIQVHQKIIEGEGKDQKVRNQIFEGMLIAVKGKGDNKTITVRKIGANQVGVERIWPLISPWITKVELKSAGRVRRAKLYYTREQSRKQLRKITQRMGGGVHVK